MSEIWQKLYDEALKALNPHKISSNFEVGFVSSALETTKGNIYVGVCVDSACSLGICAERSAIFNMLSNKEYEIRRILALDSDKTLLSPCGACRELMAQLMPKKYGEIEIMLKDNVITTLKELTPKWWF